MPFHIYVIQSLEGNRYTGQTPDLERRLSEHNSGRSHSTKHGSGWKLVYTEEFATRGEAMRREKYLKTGSGRDFLKHQLSGVESAAAE